MRERIGFADMGVGLVSDNRLICSAVSAVHKGGLVLCEKMEASQCTVYRTRECNRFGRAPAARRQFM